MPQLDWDEVDLIEFLEVLPAMAEYGAAYQYTVERDDFEFVVTIWQYESDIELKLLRKEQKLPLLHLVANVRGKVEIKDWPGERFLQFGDVELWSSRFHQFRSPPQANSHFPLHLRLVVRPSIGIWFDYGPQ